MWDDHRDTVKPSPQAPMQLKFKAFSGKDVAQILTMAGILFDFGDQVLWFLCTKVMRLTQDFHQQNGTDYTHNLSGDLKITKGNTTVVCSSKMGFYGHVLITIDTYDTSIVKRWETKCSDAGIPVMVS